MFEEAHKLLMQFVPRAAIRNAFKNLRTKILASEKFVCQGRDSEPSKFWSMVFEDYKGDTDLETWFQQSNGKTQLKEFISRAMVIPFGSSAAERSFR